MLCVPCLSTEGVWWVVFSSDAGVESSRFEVADSKGDEIRAGCWLDGLVYLPGVKKGRVYVLNSNSGVERVMEGLDEPWGVCAVGGTVIVSVKGGLYDAVKGCVVVVGSNVEWSGAVEGKGDLVVQTGWASLSAWPEGFKRKHAAEGKYGSSFYVWNLRKKTEPLQYDLGLEGVAPVSIAILKKAEGVSGYVSCAPATTVFYFEVGKGIDKVIHIPKNSRDEEGMSTGVAVSADDRLLYLANWCHGDLRQYDVTTPTTPTLCGRVVLSPHPATIVLLSPTTLLVSTCFLRSWQDDDTAPAPLTIVKADPTLGGIEPVKKVVFEGLPISTTPVIVCQ